MSIKLIGAVLILTGCGGFGFAMAAAQRREEKHLRQILRCLEYMECELQFHQTPLPQLCRMTAAVAGGTVSEVFQELAQELDKQLEPMPCSCMEYILENRTGLSEKNKSVFLRLGQTLGCFDLPGQLKGLASVKAECEEGVRELSRDRDSRLRSYQTLGLCAGAALAILFI